MLTVRPSSVQPKWKPTCAELEVKVTVLVGSSQISELCYCTDLLNNEDNDSSTRH